MASTIIFNGVEYKNSTAVKNAMRERVMEVCVKACKEEFGDELVKKVGSNEWVSLSVKLMITVAPLTQ